MFEIYLPIIKANVLLLLCTMIVACSSGHKFAVNDNTFDQ